MDNNFNLLPGDSSPHPRRTIWGELRKGLTGELKSFSQLDLRQLRRRANLARNDYTPIARWRLVRDVFLPQFLSSLVFNVLVGAEILPEVDDQIDGKLNKIPATLSRAAIVGLLFLLNYMPLFAASFISSLTGTCKGGVRKFLSTKVAVICGINGVKSGVERAVGELLDHSGISLSLIARRAIPEATAIFLTAILHMYWTTQINFAVHCLNLKAEKDEAAIPSCSVQIKRRLKQIPCEAFRGVLGPDVAINNTSGLLVFFYYQRKIVDPNVTTTFSDLITAMGLLLLGDLIATMTTIVLLRIQQEAARKLLWREWLVIGLSSIFASYGLRSTAFSLMPTLGPLVAIFGVFLSSFLSVGNTQGLVPFFNTVRQGQAGQERFGGGNDTMRNNPIDSPHSLPDSLHNLSLEKS